MSYFSLQAQSSQLQSLSILDGIDLDAIGNTKALESGLSVFDDTIVKGN